MYFFKLDSNCQNRNQQQKKLENVVSMSVFPTSKVQNNIYPDVKF